LAFVDALYEAGAVKVVVDSINDDALEMADGGPYADALVVRLPNDPRKRQQLLSIVDSEFRKAGKSVADLWRETLYFSWNSD
jgi:hypothetical protein